MALLPFASQLVEGRLVELQTSFNSPGGDVALDHGTEVFGLPAGCGWTLKHAIDSAYAGSEAAIYPRGTSGPSLPVPYSMPLRIRRQRALEDREIPWAIASNACCSSSTSGPSLILFIIVREC